MAYTAAIYWTRDLNDESDDGEIVEGGFSTASDALRWLNSRTLNQTDRRVVQQDGRDVPVVVDAHGYCRIA